ncbi:MAG TPA: hypothetical protein VMV94_12400 [Phycisphaerae bacterium]|nr:hypothetical protein [Phycisphaerae bacterium]
MDETEMLGREAGREHLAALDVLRHAKNAFLWLSVVAVVFHVFLWIIFRRLNSGEGASQFEQSIEWMLAIAGFVARASTLVVAGVFIVILLLSLSARLGGAAGLAKACVWSLAALAMLVPWARISSEDVASIPSAIYGADELAKRGGGDGADAFFTFVRFFLCPILVALFLGIAQHRFRSAYRRITMASSTKLPIREL